MCKLPNEFQLKPVLGMTERSKLFRGDQIQIEKNKELARAHLLHIQLILARRPIK